MDTATQVDGRSPSEVMEAEVAEELTQGNLHGQRLSTQQGATNGQLEGGVYDELINSLFNDESTSHFQVASQNALSRAVQGDLDHTPTEQSTSLLVSSASQCARERSAGIIEQSEDDRGSTSPTEDLRSSGNARQNSSGIAGQHQSSRPPGSKGKKAASGSGSPDSSQSDLSTADILQLRDELLDNV
jgi:hypothetical protein